MRRHLLVLGFGLAACGGAASSPAAPGPTGASTEEAAAPGERAPADVPYSLEEPPRPTAGSASQDEQWWSQAFCPEGAAPFGGAPPQHFELGCRTEKGKLEGRWVKFHESGKKAEEGSFQNNLAVGVWTSWDAQGNKLGETSYEAGDKAGLETEWYPNGKIKSQREYKAGKRDGLTVIWDDAGRKRTAVTYKDARPHGVEVRWDESGNVAKTIDHGSR